MSLQLPVLEGPRLQLDKQVSDDVDLGTVPGPGRRTAWWEPLLFLRQLWKREQANKRASLLQYPDLVTDKLIGIAGASPTALGQPRHLVVTTASNMHLSPCTKHFVISLLESWVRKAH